MNPMWIWWMFQLMVIFFLSISKYIFAVLLLWWVGKILSARYTRRHGGQSHIFKAFRQSFDE
jgi:hypothetical protein